MSHFCAFLCIYWLINSFIFALNQQLTGIFIYFYHQINAYLSVTCLFQIGLVPNRFCLLEFFTSQLQCADLTSLWKQLEAV